MSLKCKVLVFLILHSVGIVGFSIDSASPLFHKLIPIHLIVITIILCLDRATLNRNMLYFFIISFAIGYGSEVIGVQTHYLFGYYEYIEILGPKLFKVPLLLGVLWFSTTYASNEISLKLFPEYKWVSIPVAAFLMMAFDFMIEPFAVSTGMWSWRGGIIPEFNYQSWFLVGLVLSFIYQKMFSAVSNPAAPYFIAFQIWFFITVKYTNILF